VSTDPSLSIPASHSDIVRGQGKGERPNIIWVFADQHRRQALGVEGDPNVRTPNLDNLAATGTNFSRAVSGFPLCCPFRGSLLTSRYPHECVPGHQFQMPPEQPTVADAFNDAGYHTMYLGKWHLDGGNEQLGPRKFHVVPPERRGHFQEWSGYENNNDQWGCWLHGGEGEDAFQERLDGWETDCLTDRLIDYIDRRADDGQPFFTCMSFQPPHDPMVAPDEWRRLSASEVQLPPNVPPNSAVARRACEEACGYYGMIENIDWNLGRIQEALRRTGLRDRTFVMYFADHGEMLGSHGLFRKVNPHAESIDIPMIVGSWANYQGPMGKRCTVPLNHVDIAPTSLGLARIPVPEWMRGHNYASYVDAGVPAAPNAPDSAYLQSVVMTPHPSLPSQPWRGIVTDDGWKYACMPGNDWMLFDLNEDPYELANLAHINGHDARRNDLLARCRQWAADTGDTDFRWPD
jgi:arylsulfatase A-like enzyme